MFASVLAAHQETKSSRQAAVAAKDARLTHKAQEQIVASFPSIPRDFIAEILSHTLKKRSGRVGRTATIPFDESINLAVRAFIRHQLTDYDRLLRDGIKQKDARQKIKSKLEMIVGEWKEKTNKRNEPASTKTKAQSRSNRTSRARSVDATTHIETIDLTSD